MSASPALRRGVGLAPATALIVGSTVGVGIFLTPAGMARELAAPGWVLAVWAFMGACALCGALCYGELGARFPQAGGAYVYLREAYGPAAGFLYGWKCLLVMDPGLTAALATGFAAYAQPLLPDVPAPVLALGAIAATAGANLRGVRLAAGVNTALAALKLAVLLLIVAWAWLSGAARPEPWTPLWARPASAPPLLSALALALMQAFFSFAGWWESARLAGEMRDPARTLPRALVLGVALVTLLYAAVSAAFLVLVRPDAVTSAETFAAQAGALLFGERGAHALAAVVAFSVLGSLFAFMTAAPRLYYAMACDGLLPQGAGRLGRRSAAPSWAIVVQAALAAALVLVGSFEQIVAYFIFVTVAFVGLVVAGGLRLRRHGATAPFVAPGQPWTALLALVSLGLVLALLAYGRPWQAAAGVLVVVSGLPVYLLVSRRVGRDLDRDAVAARRRG